MGQELLILLGYLHSGKRKAKRIQKWVLRVVSKILIDVYEESKRQRFKRNTRIGIDLVCEMVKCMTTLVGLFMYLILSFDVVCLLKRKYKNIYIYIYIYMSYMY